MTGQIKHPDLAMVILLTLFLYSVVEQRGWSCEAQGTAVFEPIQYFMHVKRRSAADAN